MKLGYVGENAYRVVIEHTSGVSFGVTEDTEAVIMESSLQAGPEDLPAINTCQAVRNLAVMPELQEEFKNQLGLSNGFPVTYLYGFMSAEGFGPLIEMTYSTRFLAGEIGPQIGFVQGTALVTDRAELSMALPILSGIEKMLVDMDYRGEVLLGVTKDFMVSRIQFGHFTGGFALFTELAQNSPQEFYEGCLGVGEGAILHPGSVSVCTLLSYPPYPYNTDVAFSIKAPGGAEKHLYRVTEGASEVAYSATWGRDIFEAKRRCRKTIDNCKAYNKDIQYRIDLGCREKFLLCAEQWNRLGN